MRSANVSRRVFINACCSAWFRPADCRAAVRLKIWLTVSSQCWCWQGRARNRRPGQNQSDRPSHLLRPSRHPSSPKDRLLLRLRGLGLGALQPQSLGAFSRFWAYRAAVHHQSSSFALGSSRCCDCVKQRLSCVSCGRCLDGFLLRWLAPQLRSRRRPQTPPRAGLQLHRRTGRQRASASASRVATSASVAMGRLAPIAIATRRATDLTWHASSTCCWLRAKRAPLTRVYLVRDTGIEPVTSSVSGKRSPAELIARGSNRRWRRESNPCARLCRPLPHHSATPPLGLMRLAPSSG